MHPDDRTPRPAPRPTPTRRTALGVPAVLAAGAGLAGCAGSGGSEGQTSGAAVEVPVGDVPEGGGTVVSGVVVTQPAAGEYHAFDARCPHEGCAVSTVTAEAITCPCHGSTFDPASGEVTQGPAEEGLAPREVAVAGDSITVT